MLALDLATKPDEDINHQRVKTMIPLALRFAANYAKATPLEFPELAAEAFLAVAEAVYRYNPTKGPLLPFVKTRLIWKLGKMVKASIACKEDPGGGMDLVERNLDNAVPEKNPSFELEIRRALRAIRQLKPEHEEVVQRHFLNEETLTEIARTHGLTPAAMSLRKIAAVEHLRRILEKNDGSARTRIPASPTAHWLGSGRQHPDFSGEAPRRQNTE